MVLLAGNHSTQGIPRLVGSELMSAVMAHHAGQSRLELNRRIPIRVLPAWPRTGPPETSLWEKKNA